MNIICKGLLLNTNILSWFHGNREPLESGKSSTTVVKQHKLGKNVVLRYSVNNTDKRPHIIVPSANDIAIKDKNTDIDYRVGKSPQNIDHMILERDNACMCTHIVLNIPE